MVFWIDTWADDGEEEEKIKWRIKMRGKNKYCVASADKPSRGARRSNEGESSINRMRAVCIVDDVE